MSRLKATCIGRSGGCLVALLASFSACGGKATQSSDPQSGAAGATAIAGTGSVAGAPAGGDTTTSTDSGGNATAGSPSAGSAATPECDDFENQTSSLVTVGITNKNLVPIYLGPLVHGCSAPLFEVTDATGVPQTSSQCLTCQDLIGGNLHPCFCPADSVVALQPGERTSQVWRTISAVEKTPSTACWPRDTISSCYQITALQPGEFTFSAQAATALDCSESSGTCDTCLPDGNGGCAIRGALLTGPLLRAQTTVTLDASYGLGAAGGQGGDSSAPRGRPIEIIF